MGGYCVSGSKLYTMETAPNEVLAQVKQTFISQPSRPDWKWKAFLETSYNALAGDSILVGSFETEAEARIAVTAAFNRALGYDKKG